MFNEKDLLEFFNEKGDGLRRFACKILKSENFAEDMVQETLLSLWDAREKIDKSLMAQWAIVICRNKCYDYLRRRLWLDIHLGASEAEASVDPIGLEKLNIEELLELLPPKQREAIVLWMNNKSYKEIAEIQNNKPRTVAVQLQKAFEKLKLHVQYNKFTVHDFNS